MYDCVTDTNGNPLCEKKEPSSLEDEDWQQFLSIFDDEPSQSKPEDPVPKGTKQACSGSCLNPEDCNIGYDCLCASNKGRYLGIPLERCIASDLSILMNAYNTLHIAVSPLLSKDPITDLVRASSGIPLSSSWGQHTCMYVAGSAIALASAAIKPNRPCRGRCLLEEDGNIEIDGSDPNSNRTNPIDIPLANLTAYLDVVNSSDLTLGGQRSTLNNSTRLTPGPPKGLPAPQSPTQTSPILTCPCNCTYVSAACCISRTVWEDPSMQIKMQPLPANASASCDAASGLWVRNS